MNHTFLTANAMNFGERTIYAGRMLLIGMVTVFFALIILWGVLELFHQLLERSRKSSHAVVAPMPATKERELPLQDDGAVVAAITAAVSVILAEENGGKCPAFRVVSFKRSRPSK